jgi:predicted nucleotide-binding protein
MAKKTKHISRNIFIVHGRDHKPMEELKTMLYEFSLNPIVLHEQPSGSRTIVEQLERYSDVGYAFVILTPDDAGIDTYSDEIRDRFDNVRTKLDVITSAIDRGETQIERDQITDLIQSMAKFIVSSNPRSRQNVILEFGYFIGLLGRDRVCCLHKGNVELPSDMHGIVYIPFKESVREVKEMIIKELEGAGYKNLYPPPSPPP